MIITKYITLDVNRNDYQGVINTKQGNKDAINIIIDIVDGILQVSLKDVTEVYIREKKPSGEVSFNSAVVVDEHIEYTLTASDCESTGENICEVQIIKDNAVLYTPQFIVNVDENLNIDGQVEASSEFTALEQMVIAGNEVIKRLSENDITIKYSGSGEPSTTMDDYPGISTGDLYLDTKNYILYIAGSVSTSYVYWQPLAVIRDYVSGENTTYSSSKINKLLSAKVTTFYGEGEPTTTTSDYPEVKLGDLYIDKNQYYRIWQAVYIYNDYILWCELINSTTIRTITTLENYVVKTRTIAGCDLKNDITGLKLFQGIMNDSDANQVFVALLSGNIRGVCGQLNDLKTNDKSNLTAAINEVNLIAKKANIAASYTDYASMISELNEADSSLYAVGQSIYIQTKYVPDVWIYSIGEYAEYEYTTDEAFVEALNNDGYVHVGYYLISPLETQKVNLKDYDTSTKVDEKIAAAIGDVLGGAY